MFDMLYFYFYSTFQTKSKPNEGRERRVPPESFVTTYKQGGESSTRPASAQPPSNYFYHPTFTTSVSSSQPSASGHTPPAMSRTSPRPDLAPLKTMDGLQERESPMLKMQAVDANSNPIPDHNSERQEVRNSLLLSLLSVQSLYCHIWSLASLYATVLT